MKREKIEEKYKWDLKSYYANIAQWEDDFLILETYPEKLIKYEGKLNNKNDILKCLKLSSKFSLLMSKMATYSELLTATDTANPKYQEMCNRIGRFSSMSGEKTAFILVELSQLDNLFLTDLQNDTAFKDFDLMIKDIIKDKAHTLSKAEEKILALVTDFAGDSSEVFDKFNDADIKFEDILDSKGKKHKMTNALYGKYIESPDRILRQNASVSMRKAFLQFNNTLAYNYLSNVKSSVFYAKVREHKSALEASLYSVDIQKSVYDMLISCVRQNARVLYPYYDIRKKLLKLDDLYGYDLRCPIVDKVEKNIPYEDGVKIVLSALEPLGQEYIGYVKTLLETRQIDVYPNDNKDSGAFSTSVYGSSPVVCMNYTNTTEDVSTLAHELGHAIHSYYSNKNQVFEKSWYGIFLAEIASTVNEMLLFHYQLSQAKTKNEKMFYYDRFIRLFSGTVMTQTLFASFEERAFDIIEQSKPTSAQVLNEIYKDLEKEFYGNKIKSASKTGFGWSRIPHFYRPFYVFKYATGLISAIAISKKIIDGEPNAKENYIKFLSSGGSLPPLETLKIVGVDLSTKEPFESAFKMVKEIISDWKKLL